ncbi:hypothetical protein R3W88_033027 [Solanum pinnatisectum]|uniref:Uncharacterized protein n=1 Tax=Solanum pinnatisectum TaxID=50273 RepID=A0AAV9K279_9SOLN|nr:hypothetical protein R3W88_033027 [Solanum pinnatisectum]
MDDWGDFNEILARKDKFGGRTINNHRANAFRDCLDHYMLVDLGFKSCKYTWTNERYRKRQSLILERLDRSAANNPWILRFPQTTVTHLPRTMSDDCSLHPFRMEPMWCSHPTFRELIKHSFHHNSNLCGAINQFHRDAICWNKSTFGNIFYKMRRILLLIEYDSMLRLEEYFWKTKFIINWLKDGNATTKVFYVSTLKRRRKNKIVSIQYEFGNTLSLIKSPSLCTLVTTSRSSFLLRLSPPTGVGITLQPKPFILTMPPTPLLMVLSGRLKLLSL